MSAENQQLSAEYVLRPGQPEAIAALEGAHEAGVSETYLHVTMGIEPAVPRYVIEMALARDMLRAKIPSPLTGPAAMVLARHIVGDDSQKSSQALNSFVLGRITSLSRLARVEAGDDVELAKDYFQAACIGLLENMRNYDIAQTKYTPKDYATKRAQAAIRSAQSNDLFELPADQKAILVKMNTTERKLRKKLGREPTEAEILTEVDVNQDEYDAILRRADISRSADTLDEHADLIDPNPSSHEQTEATIRRELLHELLNMLSQRERKIVKLRNGLDNTRKLTLDETGKLFTVPRERIRQIEKAVNNKIAKSPDSQRLRATGDDTPDNFELKPQLTDFERQRHPELALQEHAEDTMRKAVIDVDEHAFPWIRKVRAEHGSEVAGLCYMLYDAASRDVNEESVTDTSRIYRRVASKMPRWFVPDEQYGLALQSLQAMGIMSLFGQNMRSGAEVWNISFQPSKIDYKNREP